MPISSSFASVETFAAHGAVPLGRPKGGLAPRGSERSELGAHFDSRFIMKYTSGSTDGRATTIAAIDMSTWSSRR